MIFSSIEIAMFIIEFVFNVVYERVDDIEQSHRHISIMVIRVLEMSEDFLLFLVDRIEVLIYHQS